MCKEVSQGSQVVSHERVPDREGFIDELLRLGRPERAVLRAAVGLPDPGLQPRNQGAQVLSLLEERQECVKGGLSRRAGFRHVAKWNDDLMNLNLGIAVVMV